MKKIPVYFLLLILLTLNGCTHKVTIRPDLDVTASIANQMNFRVGLYIPPEVKFLVMSDQATPADKYTFDVGRSVTSIIQKSCTRIFSYCEMLEAYPTELMANERNLDFMIVAKITEANVGLNVQEGFFQNDAKGTSQITAALSFLEKNLVQFTSVTATGTGMGSESMGVFSSGKDEFVVPVEMAIRNLGNNIVQQIYSNYDIRKRAEQKK
jgi:hypothetical protein